MSTEMWSTPQSANCCTSSSSRRYDPISCGWQQPTGPVSVYLHRKTPQAHAENTTRNGGATVHSHCGEMSRCCERMPWLYVDTVRAGWAREPEIKPPPDPAPSRSRLIPRKQKAFPNRCDARSDLERRGLRVGIVRQRLAKGRLARDKGDNWASIGRQREKGVSSSPFVGWLVVHPQLPPKKKHRREQRSGIARHRPRAQHTH